MTPPSAKPLSSVVLLGILGIYGSALVAAVAGLVGFSRLRPAPANGVWAGIFLVLIVAIGLLYGLRRYRLLLRLTLISAALTTGVVLVFSGNGPAVMAAFWLVVLAAGLGSWLLRVGRLFRTGRKPSLAWLDYALLAVPLGLGILALVPYGLGAGPDLAAAVHLSDAVTRLLRLLRPQAAYAALLLLTVLVTPALYREGQVARAALRRVEIRAWTARHEAALALGLAVAWLAFFGTLFWALSPTIRFDAVAYHLAAPAAYIDNHALEYIPEPMQANLSHYAEMLYTLALLTTGQPLPGLLALTSGLLSLAFTFRIGQRLGSTATGVLAALLLLTLPVFYDAGTAYNDFFVVMFSIASWYAILVWWQDARLAQGAWRWLALAGLLAGFSVGTKISAAAPVAGGGIAILVGQVWRARQAGGRLNAKKLFAEWLAYALPVGLLYLPWAALAAAWTGNPFFPFLCGLFHCPSAGFGAPSTSPRSLAGTFWRNFLLLPWNITVHGEDYYPESTGGPLGAVFLLALPWLLLLRSARARFRAALPLLIFVAGNLLLMLLFAFRVRYLLPILPLVCILAAMNLLLFWDALQQSAWRVPLLRVGWVVAGLLLFSTRLMLVSMGWQMDDRLPWKVALGVESPSAYLSKALPVYDALQYLNQTGSGRHNVITLGSETRLYTTSQISSLYYPMRLLSIWQTAMQAPSGSVPDGSALAQQLNRAGYDYLLVDQNQLDHLSEIGAKWVDAGLTSPAFLEKYARLVYSRNRVFVYRLFPERDAVHDGINLLQNSSFEQVDASQLPADWVAFQQPTWDGSGAQAHTGKAAVQVSNNAYIYQRVAVRGGQLYMLGHWSRRAAPGASARLQIVWLDRSLRPVDTLLQNVPTAPDWTWNQMSYIAPSEAVTAQIFINSADATPAWFDDVCFAAGSTCTP